jgi:hypothetical protein
VLPAYTYTSRTAALTRTVRAAHASGASQVRAVAADERGVTATLDLAHAPFPAAGAPYQDRTVLVFIPHHYVVPRGGAVSMVVHFHGHNTAAERSVVAHALREQLFESKQNAILVAPQGPLFAADSSCGKLEAPGGLARMLGDVLGTVSAPDGAAALARAAPRADLGASPGVGTVCVSAHSGGYHAAASSVKHGGVDVNEVYLFDALYSDVDVFRDWVITGKGRSLRQRHKLVSYYGGASTEAESRRLHQELERAGVRCAFEKVEGTLSRAELTDSEAVFIRTALPHNGVTHELNALRDCLYASGLRRRLRTAWFDQKDGARVLERRRPE